MRRIHLAVLAVAVAALTAGTGGSSALGIAGGPLTASPDPLAFGTQAVGMMTPAQTVTFTDATGSAPITILGVGITQNAADYSVSSDNCTGATLTVGDTCSVSVTFQPGSTGSDPGTLT